MIQLDQIFSTNERTLKEKLQMVEKESKRGDVARLGGRGNMNDEGRHMTDAKKEWILAKNELISTMKGLGFSEELGEAIARNLGSPKAMERMTAYLCYVKPKKEELVVDEMLAICSEIEAWRKKKASEETNMKMNRILNDDF